MPGFTTAPALLPGMATCWWTTTALPRWARNCPWDGEIKVLDLQGLSLAPRFIDAHSHNDWFALRSDPLPWFDPFIRQGITTFVTGNCGISHVGFDNYCPHMDIIGAGLFGFGDAKESSGSLKRIEAADGAMPCNMAVLAGHCTSRAACSAA